jgi:regulator of replication initiation timing
MFEAADEYYKEQRERVMEFTGHTIDVLEAMDEMMATREALAETFDENQALEILNSRLWKVMDTIPPLIEEIEKGNQMFMPKNAHAKFVEFHRAMGAMEKAREFSKELRDNAKARALNREQSR